LGRGKRLDNDKLQLLLVGFANKILDNYFEKPENNRQWRQQLNIEFKNERHFWFGHLYYNGGKRVEIQWDHNYIFKINIYHLDKQIKEKVTTQFNDLLFSLECDCFLIDAVNNTEKVNLIPFGNRANRICDVLYKLNPIAFHVKRDTDKIFSFICVKKDRERTPIFLHKKNKCTDFLEDINGEFIVLVTE
jgi:hypothetical protein